jgi:hypothetical protein
MMRINQNRKLPCSFRDPNGFLFFREGDLYRQVNLSYKDNYELLVKSGLYETLVNQGLLIPYKEVGLDLACTKEAYRVIKPFKLPFISYPYEWCFGQMKDAALTTLEIQKTAIRHGMSLKDASAYNVQFKGYRPLFIDTLSFEGFRPEKPWVAYKQFCQHFIAPLALMACRDVRLPSLLKSYIDGIPLDLTSKLLPAKTWLRLGLLLHIHLHARTQRRYANSGKTAGGKAVNFSENRHLALLDSLRSAVESLQWTPGNTEWADYYNNTNYSDSAFAAKRKIVEEFLDIAKPNTLWDAGGNIGVFSRIASNRSIETLCLDIDPSAIEFNYRLAKEKNESYLLPLVFDFVNPSPGIGWENSERETLLERGHCDTVMALALIHHLAISNNLPLSRIAGFFEKICKHIIIEFIPKEDSQVMRLLASREDIFPDYTREGFESYFSQFFEIRADRTIEGTNRIIYYMVSRC